MMLSRRSMMLAVAASPLLNLYPGARANAADLPLIRVVKAQAIGVGFLRSTWENRPAYGNKPAFGSRPRRYAVTDKFSRL